MSIQEFPKMIYNFRVDPDTNKDFAIVNSSEEQKELEKSGYKEGPYTKQEATTAKQKFTNAAKKAK